MLTHRRNLKSISVIYYLNRSSFRAACVKYWSLVMFTSNPINPNITMNTWQVIGLKLWESTLARCGSWKWSDDCCLSLHTRQTSSQLTRQPHAPALWILAENNTLSSNRNTIKNVKLREAVKKRVSDGQADHMSWPPPGQPDHKIPVFFTAFLLSLKESVDLASLSPTHPLWAKTPHPTLYRQIVHYPNGGS